MIPYLHNSAIYIIVSLLSVTLSVNSISLQTPVTNKPIRNVEVNRSQVVIEQMKCHGKLLDGIAYTKPCVKEVSPAIEPKNATDTEVGDLNKRPSTSTVPPTTTSEKSHENIISSSVSPPPSVSSTTTLTHNDFADVDQIGNPAKQQSHPNSRFDLTTGGIAALICVTIALSFYFGIMLWKRIVMNAYQNREILLNDDDIGDINDEDMRHFELKFLNKDGRVVESANQS